MLNLLLFFSSFFLSFFGLFVLLDNGERRKQRLTDVPGVPEKPVRGPVSQDCTVELLNDVRQAVGWGQVLNVRPHKAGHVTQDSLKI